MRMMKPAFGDVRAPRQWNETADRSLTQEVGMMKHQLDGCIYMSVRAATAEDEEYLVSEVNGQRVVVDGLMGLHVDDIVVAEKESTTRRMSRSRVVSRVVSPSGCTSFYIGSSLVPWAMARRWSFADVNCNKVWIFGQSTWTWRTTFGTPSRLLWRRQESRMVRTSLPRGSNQC